jgi:hypothetical protein
VLKRVLRLGCNIPRGIFYGNVYTIAISAWRATSNRAGRTATGSRTKNNPELLDRCGSTGVESGYWRVRKVCVGYITGSSAGAINPHCPVSRAQLLKSIIHSSQRCVVCLNSSDIVPAHLQLAYDNTQDNSSQDRYNY